MKMMTLRVLTLLTLWVSLVTSFELSCEKKQYKNKHYLPNLITVSRISPGNYTVNLRCQGKTRDGISIQNDNQDVKLTIENSTLTGEVTGDEHFARYVSMSCGQSCFNPLISEHDLLTGRVCMEPANEMRKSCRATSIVVTPGTEVSGSRGNMWRNVAMVIIFFNVLVALGYLYVLKKRHDTKPPPSDNKSKTNANNSNNHKDKVKDNDDINYVNEYS